MSAEDVVLFTSSTIPAAKVEKKKKQAASSSEPNAIETKEVKEPKSKKKRKEADPATASDSPAGEGDEAPKKKRKVVRFDPHNPNSYLNLTHYWKHKEVLRTGLMKAESTKEDAEEKGDEEAIALAENSIKRYGAMYDRLQSRREEVVNQLTVASSLMAYGEVAVPLVESLLGSFGNNAESSGAAAEE